MADGYRQLKKLKRKGGFQHAIFFDTETNSEPCSKYPRGELLTLSFGHAIYVKLSHGEVIQRETLDFTDHNLFWQWVLLHCQDRQPLWLFAHNLPFDLTVCRVWELLEAGIFTLAAKPGTDEDNPRNIPLVVMDDPPTIVEFRTNMGAKIVAVDTLNYWRVPLSTLGKKVGLAKQTIAFDVASRQELQDYCRNDVAILELAIVGLLNWVLSNDYGCFRYSVPSLAFSVFRSRFYEGNIELHSNKAVRILERGAYYGGRLECFQLGQVNERVTELDVAALYPFVMSKFKFPIKLVEWGSDNESGLKMVAKHANAMVAKVTLSTDLEAYPIRLEQGLCFCRGRFDTYLCGPELALAQESGRIETVHGWALYEMDSIFSPFVEHFWSKRREYESQGDALQAEFCKLMMNSLYGKFGQLAPKWEYEGKNETGSMFGVIHEWDDVEKVRRKYRVIGDRMEKSSPNHHENDGDNASPIIAAFVTAYGREWMRSLISIAGESNCFYVVTDALLVNDLGLTNLTNSGLVQERVPGKLSLKHQADTLDMRAIHQWTLGETVKRGGVKAKAKQLSETEFEETHFEGLSAMLNLNSILDGRELKHQNADGSISDHSKPLPGVVIYPQVKRLSLAYRKGILNENGRISPIVLPTPE